MQIINQSKPKKKILMLSDHALSTSGVGCQSRFLIQGLVDKGCWTVRQFGAAVKHPNYDVVTVNPDFVIKPIDGFGNRDMLLQAIAAEQPDVLFLFTDPRFFIYVWEMHEEINKICPIAYWHVWDNRPAPVFNKVLYEATDLINCHSHLTYEMVNEIVPGKANFVPHALPDELFFPIPEAEAKQHRINVLGPERQDHFVVFWVNRNARRKRPADVIEAWSKFMKMLEAEGKSDATLLMHTDPTDQEGPNLLVNTEAMGVVQSVVFSNQRIEFEKMNVDERASQHFRLLHQYCLCRRFWSGHSGSYESRQASHRNQNRRPYETSCRSPRRQRKWYCVRRGDADSSRISAGSLHLRGLCEY
jgi:hypothetical protein